ncbi:DUF2161 family putative PD-(D/E)XK-type phosphodiesterase [Paenibacillus sp. FSL H7-0350]|uniref:DUF2161 family putative PD-(D/E)XK-type phosphodiesterase n=1 Tax=Paenibacillus sp. FSL H7-0350 TaxID=2975345 RepID=UPI003158E55D
MAIKQETELYAPLKGFFERQGYEIKGEVRTCDLVGIREDEPQPLIVEMKKSFNLALLLQGIERLRLSPNVYLAVERVREKKGAVNQRWGELTGLCRRLGLGLVTVVFYKTKAPLVEVLAEPGEAPPQARSAVRRRERLLYEFRERSGDYNTGGSTRVKLVTAYREKALRVAAALQALEAEAAGAAGLGGGARRAAARRAWPWPPGRRRPRVRQQRRVMPLRVRARRLRTAGRRARAASRPPRCGSAAACPAPLRSCRRTTMRGSSGCSAAATHSRPPDKRR